MHYTFAGNVWMKDTAVEGPLPATQTRTCPFLVWESTPRRKWSSYPVQFSPYTVRYQTCGIYIQGYEMKRNVGTNLQEIQCLRNLRVFGFNKDRVILMSPCISKNKCCNLEVIRKSLCTSKNKCWNLEVIRKSLCTSKNECWNLEVIRNSLDTCKNKCWNLEVIRKSMCNSKNKC